MGWTTRNACRVGFVTVLAALLGGCFWAAPGQGSNRQAHNSFEDAIGPATVGSLHQVWSAPVEEGPVGDPITTVAGVHVKDTRAVYGFATGNGARMWRYPVAAPGVVFQPWQRGDRVRVGQVTGADQFSFDEATVELDAATGAVLAAQDEGIPLAARGSKELQLHVSPCSSACGTAGSQTAGPASAAPASIPPPNLRFLRFQVVDLDTGAVECCDVRERLVVGVPTTEVPHTLGSQFFLQAGLGTNPDATELTSGVRGMEIAQPVSCPETSPYATAAFCPTWSATIPTTAANGLPDLTVPVLSDDEATTYVGSNAGTVTAVDATTGSVRWSVPVGSAVRGSPALADGSLFVPTASGDLVVLDAATGAPLWTGSTGSEITAQPAVAGGVVFTGSANGAVTAFVAAGCGATTCPSVWSESTGSRITGAPAVSQGQLYVGTGDGRLVAYGL
jgi:hypothetical protein